MQLNASVTNVPRIGPKTAKRLKNLEVQTVKDLLYHFPFRYEDRSKISDIAEIKSIPEEKLRKDVTIKAKLTKLKNIYTRNGKKLTRGEAQDESGAISLVWFNMHYLKRSLRVGETYLMTGKADMFSGELMLVVPKMEKNLEKNIHTGRIVPIYPTTTGISTRWLRSRNYDVLIELEKSDVLKEFLPEEIRKKENLVDFKTAIKEIHFPESFESLNQARKRLGYDELLQELIQVESVKRKWKKSAKAAKVSVEEEIVKNFVKTLPFSLTKSQNKAAKEILKDLTKKHPMNRLLEGDVGTGKTIVAIIAALATTKDEKRVLYMAPTEILAKQHFATFKNFLQKEDVKIALRVGGQAAKGGSKSEGEGKSKRASKNKNEPEIIIGTHALLYENSYKKVGLVIIDEQHRFGVEQRKHLQQLKEDKTVPHLLTMTATPIPRTLALTIYGDLDISTLEEKPNRTTKVTTKVLPPSKRDATYKWIAQSKEPTFIVCPFIEESETEQFADVKAAETEFKRLKQGVFKGRSVGLLHGRLSSKEKEKVVGDFEKGKVDVLVSTPVIEVGIDIPQATIMVIESAERYGLASLHQLRGRVGRGERPGYCFVFTDSRSKKTKERLKYLEKYNSGLKLAEVDLKMRGPGEVYGTQQHGFKNFKLADLGNVELLERIRDTAIKLVENDSPLLRYFGP